tara:strand:+ start:24 stop:272 length:249 start_codon:yes stop_codon:yes gene_type:complete
MKKPFQIEIIWGEHFRGDDLNLEVYSFQTKEERLAFLRGAKECFQCVGWGEYSLIGEDTEEYATDFDSVREYIEYHDLDGAE